MSFAKILLCLSILLFKTPTIQQTEHTSLMIVAHPDDESLFAGEEIRSHPYFILCITNGDNPTRRAEFMQMLKKTNNNGIILSYPDKVNNRRSDWYYEKESIRKTLSFYTKIYDWKKIVTHNPQGEYGHQHHIMTSNIVKNITQQQNIKEKLYCFSYFKKEQNPPYAKQLTKAQHQAKVELLELYSSQEKTVHKFDHFIDYEKIVPYFND
ncbi:MULTISPECIES: PIG-L family deacetylase [unclassified Breznakia]|uniref:PIG-L family deacetylase n=1 Tax=unclassified Breznakia TaxID=2623764 RepID=UPI00247541F8|nr:MULTISPECIES: PIG-L family deacetylase [unclassified Breznakia]MDH6366006.1 LmbE family N-acetylglucosaminyl deacetylase [Breznakia sp. PH1-1]MDH6403062.1 LmbE family N-acetylglucosaminyl deacetylase [Breznakia sp. PF1-11]MDH6410771.1 LmbE family N-acetylglucosaminyl deacetylase [Breznakia sp. PFB1-11]MDH6413172.1 LmbE family N-acetylglucosaminyl deacetylase [Breznakia sp. PFB1-14]MDH6415540.1 LmbE family N-acetylglucosaminyl deacetylase [Breznakia sp. PFB1-4]